jgi:putative sugar O-methyltransferase
MGGASVLWSRWFESRRSDALEFADLVRRELVHRPYPVGYVVNKRWQGMVRDTMRQAERVSSVKQLALIGMNSGGYDFSRERVTKERAVYLRECRARFVGRNPELARIGDSPLADRRSVIKVDDVLMSSQMDQAFQFYEDIKSAVPLENVKTIVEVGGGYGRLARILHLLDPSRCYVMVDLPESLMFAYAFIRGNFPEARLKLFDGAPFEAQQHQFVFCPIQDFARLAVPSDLFINTYSLAEMNQACVNHVIGCVEALKPRYLFSLNMIFTDKGVHEDAGGYDGEANETCLPLQPNWWPERFVLTPNASVPHPRITGSVVLRRVSMPVEDLVNQLGAAAETDAVKRIGFLYFAALWSRDPARMAKFLAELRQLYLRPELQSCDLEKVGEVIFLRRLQTQVA